MSTQDTQRLYLALDEGAFVEETPRLVLRAAFAVDEDFCESYGFGKVPALAGEELEVAEHVAMQQAAYVNVRAATSPSRCLVAVAQAVSLPVSPRDAVICEVGPELPGQRILTEPLEWEQLVFSRRRTRCHTALELFSAWIRSDFRRLPRRPAGAAVV